MNNKNNKDNKITHVTVYKFGDPNNTIYKAKVYTKIGFINAYKDHKLNDCAFCRIGKHGNIQSYELNTEEILRAHEVNELICKQNKNNPLTDKQCKTLLNKAYKYLAKCMEVDIDELDKSEWYGDKSDEEKYVWEFKYNGDKYKLECEKQTYIITTYKNKTMVFLDYYK